jgi:hypothetical protein
MFRYLLLLFLFVSGPSYALNPALEKIVDTLKNRWHDDPWPVAVVDLDETLIDSTARRFYAYQEVAIRGDCGIECGKLLGLNIADFLSLENRYDLNKLFDQIGIENGTLREAIFHSANDFYLSDRFMDLDQMLPGALEFIEKLHQAGVSLFYVSSRYEDTQNYGTLKSLKKFGLLKEHDRLILRPRGMSSIEFKKRAYSKIAEDVYGNSSVELVMENEPENMNALTDRFPFATAIFIEGAYYKYEALKGRPLKLRDYR